MGDSYDVRVTREGSGPWEAAVDGLTGATYARTLSKLDTYVRELVVLGDDLPDDVENDVVLMWHFDDPELQAAHDLAQQLEELRQEQDRLVSRTHEEMRRLRERGLSTRDVAVVARSTSGRVSQVVKVRGKSAAADVRVETGKVG